MHQCTILLPVLGYTFFCSFPRLRFAVPKFTCDIPMQFALVIFTCFISAVALCTSFFTSPRVCNVTTLIHTLIPGIFIVKRVFTPALIGVGKISLYKPLRKSPGVTEPQVPHFLFTKFLDILLERLRVRIRALFYLFFFFVIQLL